MEFSFMNLSHSVQNVFFFLLKITMSQMASDSMILRVFEGICSVDPEVPVPPGGGVSREQLVIFLADALRGTAEERAPLVMAMAHGNKAAVTTNQIREVSMCQSIVQILTDFSCGSHFAQCRHICSSRFFENLGSATNVWYGNSLCFTHIILQSCKKAKYI